MDKKSQAGGTKESTRFIVDIRYRENATWQGEVRWVDQNKQCSFRSALELLKLIDGVLDREEAFADSTGEKDIVESSLG